MKKLKLKEQPKPKDKKWTKAHLILNNAKEDIKKFIKLEAVMLYKSIYGRDPDFEDEGGWRICTGDLCGDLYIDVKTEGNGEILSERVEIAEILICLDDSVIVINEDGDEWNDSDITLEELANVSDLLELTYLNKVQGLD